MFFYFTSRLFHILILMFGKIWFDCRPVFTAFTCSLWNLNMYLPLFKTFFKNLFKRQSDRVRKREQEIRQRKKSSRHCNSPNGWNNWNCSYQSQKLSIPSGTPTWMTGPKPLHLIWLPCWEHLQEGELGTRASGIILVVLLVAGKQTIAVCCYATTLSLATNVCIFQTKDIYKECFHRTMLD